MTAGTHAATGVASQRGSGLRLDVEGLRAVAILAVLAYHASLPFLPGGFVGVDIFFVISGFLITGLLVREAERSGRISIARFYARRAKRLLPAAALVFVATAIGTGVLYAGSAARVFGGDIVAAAAYVVNWRLAARSVDYLAEDTGQSPVLHFWSLSVEEQYYVVWPLLAIVAILVARRWGHSIRAAMGVGLVLIVVPSFAWALYQVHVDPARAFFVTPTRMWELGIGAAVALAAPVLARMARRTAQVVGGVGGAAVMASLVVLNDAMAWPGLVTALPVVGTAAVIAAGGALPRNAASLVLGIRPLVWVGAISYSLYLWHWPILVLAGEAFGPLRVWHKVVLCLVAFVPAYVSLKLVENPVRFSEGLARSARKALLMGGVLTLVGVGAGVGVIAAHANTIPPATGPPTSDSQLWGAAALGDDPATSPAGDPAAVPATIIPAPADAPDDVPSGYSKGCQATATTATPKFCDYGDPNGGTHIVVLGDSKMFQYAGALDIIGREHGWRITTAIKSACSWTAQTATYHDAPYVSCGEFNARVLDYLTEDPPDFVLTSGSPYPVWGADTTDALRAEGLAEQWHRTQATGAQVIVLVETPRPTASRPVYECVTTNRDNPSVCAFDRAHAVEVSAAPSQVLAADAVDGVAVVSISDYVCPRSRCAPVIGGVLVYRQGSHMTNSYAQSLVPILGARLAAVIDNGDQRVGPTFVEAAG